MSALRVRVLLRKPWGLGTIVGVLGSGCILALEKWGGVPGNNAVFYLAAVPLASGWVFSGEISDLETIAPFTHIYVWAVAYGFVFFLYGNPRWYQTVFAVTLFGLLTIVSMALSIDYIIAGVVESLHEQFGQQ